MQNSHGHCGMYIWKLWEMWILGTQNLGLIMSMKEITRCDGCANILVLNVKVARDQFSPTAIVYHFSI